MLTLPDVECSLYALIPRGEMFDKVPSQVRILNPRVSSGSVLSARGRIVIFVRMVRAFFYRFTGFRMLPYLFRNGKLQKAAGRMQYDKLLWRLLAEGTPPLRESFDLGVAYIEGASVYYLADRVQAMKKASFLHIDYTAAGYHPMMDQNCYDRIDRIFTVSNEAGRRFAEIYPQHAGKLSLFRNIVDRQAVLRKAEDGEGFADSYAGVRLVTVGRLARQKGYDIAVQAMAKIVSLGYDARWYVIGDGPERKALEKLILKLGMREHFILLGAKSNPYLYIREADLYVQPSRFEGWGIAVEEALILKKPVLASNCTGVAEQIVSGQNGILCAPDVTELAAQLKRLLSNPQEMRSLATGTLAKPGDTAGLTKLLKLLEQAE
jgi:glycosyltransferase involved in cell wall biosynthesis